MLCSRYDPGLFAVRDALKRTTVNVRLSVANFNNHQRLLVAHHQVKFAMLTAIIPANLLQSFAKQKDMRLIFRAFTTQQMRGFRFK